MLKFVWRGRYSIEFTDDALEEILSKATELENKFKYDQIPLITNDQKYKLAKLSVSLANLTCSFNDDFTKLQVTKNHVEYIANLINAEYHNAGLDIYASSNRIEINDEVIDDVYFSIKEALDKKEPKVDDEFCKKLLSWIAQQTKFKKDQLLTQFDLPEKNQGRPLLAVLQNEKLIRPNAGFIPTKKLIEIGKYLINQGKGVSTLEDGKGGKEGKNQKTLPRLPTMPGSEQDTHVYFCLDCNTKWVTSEPIEKIRESHSKGHRIKEIQVLESYNIDYVEVFNDNQRCLLLQKQRPNPPKRYGIIRSYTQ